MSSITYRTCLKRAAEVTLALMILNVLRKLLFSFNEVIVLKNQFLATSQKLTIIGTVFLVVLAIWALISICGGTIYYFYRKIRES